MLSILSIASMTYSGFLPSVVGPSNAGASARWKSWLRQSKVTQGVTAARRLRRQCTLGVPTSASVATAWRLRDERETWSKSIRRMVEAPERARAETQCEPTPPHPTTMKKALRSFVRPSSVRKTLFLASCSSMRSKRRVVREVVCWAAGLYQYHRRNPPFVPSQPVLHSAHLLCSFQKSAMQLRSSSASLVKSVFCYLGDLLRALQNLPFRAYGRGSAPGSNASDPPPFPDVEHAGTQEWHLQQLPPKQQLWRQIVLGRTTSSEKTRTTSFLWIEVAEMGLRRLLPPLNTVHDCTYRVARVVGPSFVVILLNSTIIKEYGQWQQMFR